METLHEDEENKMKALHEDEENKKEKKEELEEKETLVATIEVSTESSFQFCLQTLIALPQFLISTVGAYKSKDSFRKEFVTWQNISILFSFLAMAKTFHRIRNLSKQNALSGKAAILNFLLTTFETTARILCFGLFLYLYAQNLDAMVAVGMYYGHVLIMILFNLVFNEERPTCSVAYWLGLLLNALSSVFTYNNYQYANILGNKKSEKKLHQPSLVRQLVFYSVILMENLALTASSCMFFDEKEKSSGSVYIADGFGGKFQMSRGNFQSVVGFIWFCQGAAILMRMLYYSVHPSDVSITDIPAKNQIYAFGNKLALNCHKIKTGCCASCACYLCCRLKDNALDGETGDVESRISNGADGNSQDNTSDGQTGGLQMDELTTREGDLEAGLIFNEADGNLEDGANDGQNGRLQTDAIATTIFNEADGNLEDGASDGQNGRLQMDEIATTKGDFEAGLTEDEDEIEKDDEEEVKLQLDSWLQFGDQVEEVFELSILQLFKETTWKEAKSYCPDTYYRFPDTFAPEVNDYGELVMPGHDEEMAIQSMQIVAYDRYGPMVVRRSYTFIIHSQFIEPPSLPTDIKFMEEDDDMETSRAALVKEMEDMSWDELASHPATYVTWELLNL